MTEAIFCFGLVVRFVEVVFRFLVLVLLLLLYFKGKKRMGSWNDGLAMKIHPSGKKGGVGTETFFQLYF